MATHASAKKRARQTIKRTLRNKAVKSRMRTFVNKLRSAVAENNPEEAQKLLSQVMREIHRAAKKGVIKDRTASRKIARLSRLVHTKSSGTAA